MTLSEAAARLGGEVSGDAILCPGPGHSAGDRSLSVKLNDKDGDGFVVHSFSGDNWKLCRTHVRQKLGIPEPRSQGRAAGAKKNGAGGGKWTVLAEHVYRDQDDKPYLKVRKCRDGNGAKQFPQFHWDGKAWAKGKPKGPKIPYLLPQLLKAAVGMPVYFCEGEKDADAVAKLGFVATTASEGASTKWDAALTPYFKDRHVVILPDADKPGRAHGQKVARAINGVAASVRVLDLYPDRNDGSDVSNWLADDTAGAKLAQLAKEAPLWEPSAQGDDTTEAADAVDVGAELGRLAKLTTADYERERNAAAKKLGFRASVLDKLRDGERARLGLDGGDDLQGQPIEFPEIELWPEPVGGAVLNELADTIRQYVVMSDAARDICALWVVHTFVFAHFPVSPKLSIRSVTKGSGKTTLLDVLNRLVARALLTGNITAAALFRVIAAHRPTLLIDEVDTFVGDNEELRGMLNHSHRHDGHVTRTVGESFEPRRFSVYAPTALAGIGKLVETLTDRSIVVELKRRLPREPITQLRFGRTGHLDELQRRVARFIADHSERITTTEPVMPAGIINREADNWLPLLAIADVAGGEWPVRARKAATAAHSAAADDAGRLELLLGDIRTAFGTADEMPSADLVKALVELDGRPWAEMGRSSKPLTQNRLARMLRPLGIAPQKTGPEKARINGYVRKHFEDAFGRYLGLDGGSQPDIRTERDEMGTSDISQPDSPENDCPVANTQETQQPRASVRMSGCEGGSRGEQAYGDGPPGLSKGGIRELAEHYTERAYANAQENEGDTHTAELDGWLRQRLADEGVPPEFIEVEFKRVMDEVFRV